MTTDHDLLARIEEQIDLHQSKLHAWRIAGSKSFEEADHVSDYIENEKSILQGFKALRAVVKLHEPVKGITSPRQCSSDTCQEWIESMYEPHTYPCPTIQAIEKELG